MGSASCAAALACSLLAAGAACAGELDAALAADVQRLATQAARAGDARVEVEVGALDARLKLAPCTRIEPFVPPHARLAGRTRIGLRCIDGPSRWSVWLPLQVKIFGRALVARSALPAGSTLAGADLAEAEVDLVAEPGAPSTDASRLLGRVLARDVAAGSALRDTHLQPRRWFAAGDEVRIVAAGNGWQVASSGVALAPGIDGESVRVRTEGGRVVSGRASAPRRIDLGPAE